MREINKLCQKSRKVKIRAFFLSANFIFTFQISVHIPCYGSLATDDLQIEFSKKELLILVLFT